MNELTPVATKILGVFKYFKVKKNSLLSTKLLLSKTRLWRDIDEITYERALDELLEKEFIRESMGEMPGFLLSETGADYLKDHK
jgi:hypothetical protein